jgi:hypothetical protein
MENMTVIHNFESRQPERSSSSNPVSFGSKVSGKKNLMWFLSNKSNLHNQYNLAERKNCHAAAV